MSTTTIRLPEELKARVADAADRVADIAAAIDVLRRNPMIGRRAGGPRGLIIGKGSRGRVALYDWHPERDTAEVMAIRALKGFGLRPLTRPQRLQCAAAASSKAGVLISPGTFLRANSV